MHHNVYVQVLKIKAAHAALILASEYLTLYFNIFEHIILHLIVFLKISAKRNALYLFLEIPELLFVDMFPGKKNVHETDTWLGR